MELSHEICQRRETCQSPLATFISDERQKLGDLQHLVIEDTRVPLVPQNPAYQAHEGVKARCARRRAPGRKPGRLQSYAW
jgi:hypothetical protein